jgi:outer membrane protein OmpA-like peptidoglycan-associated protein
MRKLFLSTVFSALTLAAPGAIGTALAQSNPTASQLINALKPTGSLTETTRGIKPVPPGDASDSMGGMSGPAPVHASMSMPQQAAPMAPITPRSANLDIDFRPGSAELTPSAKAELDQLGKALTSADLAGFNFKIVGHTDTTGDAATNQSLSDQRAAAVKTYLETKFNVTGSRLQSEGVGEADLLVPTPPQTPEQRNRRVQIINLGQ